jgi:hypothetical protein
VAGPKGDFRTEKPARRLRPRTLRQEAIAAPFSACQWFQFGGGGAEGSASLLTTFAGLFG